MKKTIIIAAVLFLIQLNAAGNCNFTRDTYYGFLGYPTNIVVNLACGLADPLTTIEYYVDDNLVQSKAIDYCAADSLQWKFDTQGIHKVQTFVYHQNGTREKCNNSGFNNTIYAMINTGRAPAVTVSPGEKVLPQIANLNVEATFASATFSWETVDEKKNPVQTTNTIFYGKGLDYSNQVDAGNSVSPITTIGDLEPETFYHYKLVSCDAYYPDSCAEYKSLFYTQIPEQNVISGKSKKNGNFMDIDINLALTPIDSASEQIQMNDEIKSACGFNCNAISAVKYAAMPERIQEGSKVKIGITTDSNLSITSTVCSSPEHSICTCKSGFDGSNKNVLCDLLAIPTTYTIIVANGNKAGGIMALKLEKGARGDLKATVSKKTVSEAVWDQNMVIFGIVAGIVLIASISYLFKKFRKPKLGA